jgi:UPF0755 protein
MSSSKLIRYILYGIVLIIILSGIKIISVYKRVYSPNIQTPDRKPAYLYIPTGSTYQDVLDSIYGHKLVKNRKSFEWVVLKKNYATRVHPGRYRVEHNMSNSAFINMLRSGMQEPVKVVINNARTTDELVRRLATQIEPDASELIRLIRDEDYIGQYGFNKLTILGMFLPNTYEFWWNISAKAFFTRMHKEYDEFWNSERTRKAKSVNLDRNEIITLASILINETNKEAEYPRIAGVYINRLNKGIKLQADPTIKYALGDYERKRILKKDILVDSPFNTYLHYGLPPGPIALPSIRAIDAVLNYEKHDYLFFCAKEDFSGYHNFAKTLDQHNKNARSYQKALNRRKILK